MNPIVDSAKLERAKVWGQSDSAVRWQGAFARYGGNGSTASSVIVYEIEPGGRLGWHTDATEETQYIIAGSGKLHLEDGSTVGPGSVFVLPTPMRHDLENTGKDTLRAVRLLCRGDVHANLRSGDAAAEDTCSRHAKPRRPDSALAFLVPHNRHDG